MVASWAVQALLVHRTRSLLTVLGVGLSTALLASTLGFQAGYERSLKHNIDAMGYQVLLTGKGCPHEAATLILRGGSIPMYIREEMYEDIVALPGVQDSTRFFMQTVPLPEESSHQLYVGIDDRFLRLKPSVSFQRGTWFSSDIANEVILGFNVAEYRRLGEGDQIEIRNAKFVVRGILDKLGTQDDGTVFLPLLVGQDLFEKRGLLTGIGIRLEDMSDWSSFVDRVYEYPSVQVVRMSQVQDALLRILTGIRSLLLTFGGLCLVVALMGVFNVALIAMNERRGEMGVLRAMGCSGPTLFALVWCESLAISLCGAGLGAALGIALHSGTEWVVHSTLPFVPAGTVVDLTPLILARSSALVVVLCLLAGVYPAWRSAVVAPMTSMRGSI
jgi:ABC-type lipoprotein release transport system permease subunit